jgi:beta-glucosidase
MKKQNFFWGASTSSYQIEGGNKNQWSIWELANASELAKNASKQYGGLPIWDEIKDQASNPENYVCNRGVDHYNRYKEDFDLLTKLNLNAFRFGIEWSRIEPEEGVWDIKAITHYKEYIKELRKRGVEPFATLWHWTMPVWFTNKGGFAKSSNIKYFEEYIEKVAEEILGDVDYVITLNEPNSFIGMSFTDKRWPPFKKSIIELIATYLNLIKVHNRIYKILKNKRPNIQISTATQLGNLTAARPGNLIDELVAKIARYAWNWWWLNRVSKRCDFIGFNYYFTDYIKNFKRLNPSGPNNDFGWYMEPGAILYILRWLNKRYPNKPIIVIENGVADANDKYRKWWLEQTMQALGRAKKEGIPIKGYMHWSLLDNFEWADGWWPKFGLVAVDPKTLKRTIRPSALWWAKEIESENVAE